MRVPTTKRSCRCALACAGMAFTGKSGLPVRMASTSSAFQASTRSIGVWSGSPQSASTAGSPDPPPTCSPASAARTLAGIGGGRRPSTRMRPRPSTRLAIAEASTVPGLRSRPPQLPEWWAPSRSSRLRSKLAAPRVPRNTVGKPARNRGPSLAISASAASKSRCAAQNSASPGEPVSSPVSISHLTLKPSLPPRAAITIASAAMLMLC